MRKLKLELDDLSVDTFATGADGGGVGTVEGNRQRTVTDYPLSCWQSCWPEDTCPGCTDTCAAWTCGGDTCGCGVETDRCGPDITQPV